MDRGELNAQQVDAAGRFVCARLDREIVKAVTLDATWPEYRERQRDAELKAGRIEEPILPAQLDNGELMRRVWVDRTEDGVLKRRGLSRQKLLQERWRAAPSFLKRQFPGKKPHQFGQSADKYSFGTILPYIKGLQYP